MITKDELFKLGYTVKQPNMQDGATDYHHPNRVGKYLLSLSTDGDVTITLPNNDELRPIKTVEDFRKWHDAFV